MSTALHELAALALVEGYRRRDFSPLEVAQSLLDHVARWEPQLCALYAFEPEAVLAQARASEARWLRGEPLTNAQGLTLDGVPATLKENIATRGTPVPWARRPPSSRPPPRTRRPPPACASWAPCCWPRPPCRTTAC